MRSLFKKVGIAALAALSLVGATLAASSTAEARYYGRGWRGWRLGRPGHRWRSGARRLAASASLLLRWLRWLRWLWLLRRRLYPDRVVGYTPYGVRSSGQSTSATLSDSGGGVGGPRLQPQEEPGALSIGVGLLIFLNSR